MRADAATGRLELDNEILSVERSAAWLADGAERLGLTPDLVFRLQLCLEEALTNVIRHGGGRSILLTVVSDGETILLTLEDDGAFFDPTRAEAPDLPETLEEARIGGLGVYFMREFSQAIDYARAGGRNRLTLTFRRQ